MMQGSNSVENLLFLSYWPNKHRAALIGLLFAGGDDTLEEISTIQNRCSWRKRASLIVDRPEWRPRRYDQKRRYPKGEFMNVSLSCLGYY
jgi:hypothetical protein